MKMNRRLKNRRGTSTVEFALIGIPIIFMVIGVVEMARGMWIYQTLSYATHTVARHITVRGAGCSVTNTCSVTIGNLSKDFAGVSNGLDPALMNVTFYSTNTSVACNPLNTCYSSATAWPPTGDNSRGSDIRIAATCAFQNALLLFWPGRTPVTFGPVVFSAYSRQQINF